MALVHDKKYDDLFQSFAGNKTTSVPLAPHQAAALEHSFGGNMKKPLAFEKWRENGNSVIDECDTLNVGYDTSKRVSSDFANTNMYWKPGAYPVSVPSSGLSRASSKDDLTSVEGHVFEYEERFRVDRRKLELMMIGRFDAIKEEASVFFQRIGEETNTTIIWPSRLKIGAKSKKDPHIRVGGDTHGVKQAKALIIQYLDTKTNRVTMKMDVSYTDHSHIIGKGGNTIRRVMAETGCHIHFPDSNRSNPSEKSNQVSIAGEIEGVEKARARVRELTPLVFTFDLPLVPRNEAAPDPSDPYLRAIQDQYNVQVMFRQKQKNYPTTLVVVKGCQWEPARVKDATMLLVDHFCGVVAYSPGRISGGGGPNMDTLNLPNTEMTHPTSSSKFDFNHYKGMLKQPILISMNMEISPIHHGVVLGKGNSTLRTIMQRTNTTILFPEAGDTNIPSIRKGSVTITGSIHNIYFARQQLLGCLPLVMMFEMPDNNDMIDEISIQKLQEKLDVNISIKPKQRQANKSVLIKAQERNASNIYKARHILLGIEDIPIVAEIPDTYLIRFGSTYNDDSTTPDYEKNGVLSSTPTNSSPSTLPPFIPQYQNPWNLAQQQGWNSSPCSTEIRPPFANVNLPTPCITRNHGDPAMMQPCSNISNRYPNISYGLDNYGMIGHQPFMQMSNSGMVPVPIMQQLNQNTNIYQQLPEMNHGQRYYNLPINQRFGNALPPNHPYLQDYARLVLKNITRLQQQEEQQVFNKTPGNKGLSNNNIYEDDMGNISPVVNELTQRFSKLSPNSNEQHQNSDLQMDSKSRLQLLAPPPLTGLPTSDGNSPTSGDSIVSPELSNTENLLCDSSLVGSRWFAHSNGLDALISSKSITYNNDPFRFDDDLPSLFAKQGLAKYTDLFLRHEVDIQTFSTLTEQDLKEIGITTFGARKKLLFLSNKVKQVLIAQSPTISSTTPHQWLQN